MKEGEGGAGVPPSSFVKAYLQHVSTIFTLRECKRRSLTFAPKLGKRTSCDLQLVVDVMETDRGHPTRKSCSMKSVWPNNYTHDISNEEPVRSIQGCM